MHFSVPFQAHSPTSSRTWQAPHSGIPGSALVASTLTLTCATYDLPLQLGAIALSLRPYVHDTDITPPSMLALPHSPTRTRLSSSVVPTCVQVHHTVRCPGAPTGNNAGHAISPMRRGCYRLSQSARARITSYSKQICRWSTAKSSHSLFGLTLG